MESDSEEIKPLKRRRKKPQQNAKLSISKDSPVKEMKQTFIPCSPSPSKTNNEETDTETELSSSQEKEIFKSSNNKAVSRFFTLKKSPLPGKKYGVCPVCFIDLNFLHGISPTAHINLCLDCDPEFEKGYCSGDSSCSLSNEKHFRDFQHDAKSHSCLQTKYSETERYENEKQCISTINATDKKEIKNQNDNRKSDSIHTNEVSTIDSTKSPIVDPNKGNKTLTQTCIGVYFGGKDTKMPPVNHIKPPSAKKNVSTVKDSVSTVQTKKGTMAKKKRVQPKKECPFYKKIPGTGITVDAFRYSEIPGCNAYFLTHFHSDHYIGLTKTFNGKVFCSNITANLVVSQLQVKESCIVRLPMYEETIINGVAVTLLDANHCPGSVLFLLQLQSGERILHVGDFRADESMFSHNLLQRIHTLYLDTTYCDPKHTFPPQKHVIQFVINITKQFLKQNARTLIVCGAYTIGKERVFKSLAHALGIKIGVTEAKMKVLQCIEDEELFEMLTLNHDEAQLHVLPLGSFNQKKLSEHLAKYKHKQFDRLLAFKPTGWTFSSTATTLDDIKPYTSHDVTTYGVPYSEHSSYAELKWFVETLKPKKIIPTVNIGTQKSRDAMEVHFKNWLK